jgi:hypothetical protein
MAQLARPDADAAVRAYLLADAIGFVGPAFRIFARDVDTFFGHHRDSCGIDLIGRFRTTRVGDRTIAREPVGESERHLRAPSVVGAQEPHGGFRHGSPQFGVAILVGNDGLIGGLRGVGVEHND